GAAVGDRGSAIQPPRAQREFGPGHPPQIDGIAGAPVREHRQAAARRGQGGAKACQTGRSTGRGRLAGNRGDTVMTIHLGRFPMRIRVLASGICLALLLATVSASQDDTIKVDLKSFKFKVKEDFASLFGYNEDDGKLFFYTNGPAEAT